MRLTFFLLALGLASAILVPSAMVRGDGGDIEVLDVSANSDFPDGVRFSVTARSSEEIEEIRVFFTVTGRSGTSAYRNLEFEPGKEVTGESLLRTSGGGAFIPPGTELEYSFEVRDKSGAVFRTPGQEFIYDDNRFDWRTVSSDLITVFYYGEYVEKRARTVLEAAQEAFDLMVPVLGIEPTEPLRIVSYNNYRDMSAALPFRAQAVRERLQTQGQAFVAERVLLVHGFDPTIKGTTSHEFVHLLVAEAAGSGYSRVPAWLNEGLAEYGNIDPTSDYPAALRYGIYTRRIKPLWFQRSFGGTPDDIIIAYGQARSVVKYLISMHGESSITELFTAIQTQNIDGALEQVYGFDQHGLDSLWRSAVGLEPLPPPQELNRQLENRQTAVPEIASTPEPVTVLESTPTTESDTVLESTPTPAPTPVSSLDEGEGQSSTGCNAPIHGQNGTTPIALSSLLLLGAPLALLSFQGLRRRRRR